MRMVAAGMVIFSWAIRTLWRKIMTENDGIQMPHSDTPVDSVSETALLSLGRAALMLGVSQATVRNWIKAGHLTPAARRPVQFQEQAILDLQSRIISGEVERLRTRANKTSSRLRFIPAEYTTQAGGRSAAARVLALVRAADLDMTAMLFCVAMRLLELSGDVARIEGADGPRITSFHSWRRRAVEQEMQDWHAALAPGVNLSLYEHLYQCFHDIEGDDVLGLMYQALSMEGDKSTRGSYYTPVDIVRAALGTAQGAPSSFLDPCCGTGQYLLNAAAILGLGLNALYGFDIDALATRIARINLLLAFPFADIRPQVECMDMLATGEGGAWPPVLSGLPQGVDFIATNPPWGTYTRAKPMRTARSAIRSQEAFSLFLAKSIDMLKEGGSLSFILPESILKIRLHADVRELILRRTQIKRIVKLGRVFSGVFTPAIRMDLVKAVPQAGARVVIEGVRAAYSIEQSRFLANDYFAFDIQATEAQDRLLKKLFERDYITLKGHAEWALGLVTGNNAAFVKDQLAPGSEAIVKGRDILPFRLGPPRSFILYEPERFQQAAKAEFYRVHEKLVYKFISKTLVFAYDNRQTLTLNSANILIPHMPGLSLKTVLGFLNSRVFQYMFSRLFSTHKVLRGDLERLPFPRISAALDAEIERVVDGLIAGQPDTSQLNRLIYQAFQLDADDIAQIELA